ncbi:MAG: LamG domain-containing protein, partial [Cyanothece sp. SIO1E1]|nr:LamG domain-containing protein [Cyanothece sp. SIO1E1]
MNNPVSYILLKLSANAYAQTADNIGIALDGTMAFSVDAWVKFNGLCSTASILSKDGVFNLGISGNMVVFQIDGYPPVQSDPSKQSLNDETWHYICATYEQGHVRIFIDGEFNVFQSISGTGQSTTSPFLLGHGLQALVKSVRVYNLAL